MIAITALLSLGALTVLTVQVEHQSGGQTRFQQQALYAAESGAYAGIDFLRANCQTLNLFSQWVSANNATIQSPTGPTGIIGNKVMPGQTGNPFDPAALLWYEVQILNNDTDPGFTGIPCPNHSSGPDCDAIVVLRSTGHAPDNTVATVDVTAQNAGSCINAFCAQEYAQRDVGERNTASVACSARVTNTNMRTVKP
jgi:hypothetical protein